MAIDLTLKGTAITNRDATPQVFNNPGAGGAARVREVQGYLAVVTASLSITSIIRLCDIPSNAVISNLRIYSAAQTAGKVDVGLYRNTKDGGAAVDVDFFASAVDLASAVDGTDITNESTSFTIAKRSQPIWQAVGATVDPQSTYDIALTVVTTDFTTAGGAVMAKCQYVA